MKQTHENTFVRQFQQGLLGLVILLGIALTSQSVHAQAMPLMPEPAQAKAVADPAADQAIKEILEAVQSEDSFLRANAIEAMQPIPDRAAPLVQLGLEDESAVVRFTALMTMGKLQLETMQDSAKRLLNDEDLNVRAAAIYACHATGFEADPSLLAKMLSSTSPGLRSNAAMVVGRLNQPGAAEMVKTVTRTPMRRVSAERRDIVRVQVAEAMVMLGDETGVDAIRAFAYSPFDEVKISAILALGRLQDEAMAAGLSPMLSDGPIEIRLAAARSLGDMGVPDGQRLALEASEHEHPVVRAQAAFSLAAMRTARSTTRLVELLDDESPQVRLSAAAGILKLSRP